VAPSTDPGGRGAWHVDCFVPNDTWNEEFTTEGEAMLKHQDASGGVGPISVTDPIDDADGVCPECEETLIADHRASLGPAQWVEHKLSTLLGGALPPVSHVRMLAQLGRRSHC
jgi:hypothetical protein